MSLNNGLNNGSTSSDSTNSVGAITAPGMSSNMPDCSIGAFGLGGHPPPLQKSDIEIENDFNLAVNPVESGSPKKQPTVVRFLKLFLTLIFLLTDSIKI